MNSLRRTIIFLSAILCGALSPNAHAVCTTSDIAGAWRIFAITGSQFFQGVGRGTLLFSPTGVVNTQASFIVDSDGVRIGFLAGRTRVAPICNVVGRLLATSGVLIVLVDGRMDRNKTVISGVYRTSSGDLGLVNLIR